MSCDHRTNLIAFALQERKEALDNVDTLLLGKNYRWINWKEDK